MKNTETVLSTEKPAKVLTQSDKIAMRVLEKIRENRGAWEPGESAEFNTKTHFYKSVLGTASVVVARVVSENAKGKTFARAQIVVTPEAGKPLTITGGLAAKCYHTVSNVDKVASSKISKEYDPEVIAAVESALGL